MLLISTILLWLQVEEDSGNAHKNSKDSSEHVFYVKLYNIKRTLYRKACSTFSLKRDTWDIVNSFLKIQRKILTTGCDSSKERWCLFEVWCARGYKKVLFVFLLPIMYFISCSNAAIKKQGNRKKICWDEDGGVYWGWADEREMCQ